MDINELLSKFDSGQLIGLVLRGIALWAGQFAGSSASSRVSFTAAITLIERKSRRCLSKTC